MKEWFVEVDWFENKEDVEKYVLPLYLEQTDLGSHKVVFLWRSALPLHLSQALSFLP